MQVRLLLGEVPDRTEFTAPDWAQQLVPYFDVTQASARCCRWVPQSVLLSGAACSHHCSLPTPKRTGLACSCLPAGGAQWRPQRLCPRGGGARRAGKAQLPGLVDAAAFDSMPHKPSLQPACLCLPVLSLPLTNTMPPTSRPSPPQFRADRTHNLIVRLRHSVIRAGLRRISLAYSRISLQDVVSVLVGFPFSGSLVGLAASRWSAPASRCRTC